MSKTRDVAVQRQVVFEWLEGLFGDEDVPDFELNTTTLSYLYDLCQINLTKERQVQLVVSDLQQKTEEYQAEAQRLEAVLNRLNFGQGNMSQMGLSCSRTLSRLGLLFDVRDVSETSYYLAMQALDAEIESVEHEKEAETMKLKTLVGKSESILGKHKSLQRAYEMVTSSDAKAKQEMEKKKENSIFYQNKAKSYKKNIERYENQLSKTQVDESLYHETLVKKAEQLQSLKDMLAPLAAELHSFSILPPNITEAKVKVEEEKKELERLKNELVQFTEANVIRQSAT